MSVLVKKYEKELEKFTKKMDQLYEDYKLKLGKEIGALPSERLDYDPCSPKYVRKYLKYIPSDKEKREIYIADMLNVCTTCAVKQRDVPKPKKPISGWICYLKTCTKESDMDYRDCMKDSARKEKEYNPKKKHWAEEAAAGCPSGV
ncbi:unnamed protein product [marine sediment metagenome]|uniref:Uncharacterized protein n=1 Tax=marine sediment metagenome TaxID=412755 RepID=X0X9P7_9ZZZZ